MKLQLKKIANFVDNMGLRYVSFRLKHELLRRTGLLKSRFPASPDFQQYITLRDWKLQSAPFFFSSRSDIRLPHSPNDGLKNKVDDITSGKHLLFNSTHVNLGADYDWVTNPDSGHVYDTKKHWTEIPDLSKEAGDIKYVWEKSRFSYLYDIIRYDHHFEKDSAKLVFDDIISWIEHNPINCGPNYRCSQEMSLRSMNWLFALYFYKESPHLTEAIFDKIQHTLYWHFHHIYANINFSRIAVRNNHAITETLMLYLAGLYFPQFPGADLWKANGKKWFEEEVAYQIYEDGTFLQFSMNYHRVVVQLLTWAIVLSEKNGERFSDVVYDRAAKSLRFLRTCMIDESGWLPNYGANDGALFFPLSTVHYRDYRPQLQALACALKTDAGIENSMEDAGWYGLQATPSSNCRPEPGIHKFDTGGYYIIREQDTLTFIKCGGYKDRPSQADNLHIDIWYKGENVLSDAGSYKYNTESETLRYFNGTRSHNTVMLDDADQMLKGGRFMWFYWTQKDYATLSENADSYVFEGSIRAFRHLGNGIHHQRTVYKVKGKPEWRVKDRIVNKPAKSKMYQLWHFPLNTEYQVVAKDSTSAALTPIVNAGWSSSLYGQKEEVTELSVSSDTDTIETVLSL